VLDEQFCITEKEWNWFWSLR